MCMWQSQAFAGALSSGRSVPDEYGTCSSARATPPRPSPAPAAAIAATARSAGRRPIILDIIVPAPPCARPPSARRALGADAQKLLLLGARGQSGGHGRPHHPSDLAPRSAVGDSG